jgi:hypothetical protein
MKIGIMGTHGIGKTTMAMKMASDMKQSDPGQSIGFLSEIARDCPFPLNENMTEDSQRWILSAQLKAELECGTTYDTLICDRTIIDGFAYALWAGMDSFVWKYIHLAVDWICTYDRLIWMRPRHDNDFPADDGFRSPSRLFQVGVDLKLAELIDTWKLNVISPDNPCIRTG